MVHATHVSGLAGIQATKMFIKEGSISKGSISRYNEWLIYYSMTKILVIASKAQRAKIKYNIGNEELEVPMSLNVMDAKLNRTFCWAIGPVTADEATRLGLNKLSLYKHRCCT